MRKGWLDLMETATSSKPFSSQIPTCRLALSTKASAVGDGDLSSKSFSSDPSFTPILIGILADLASDKTRMIRFFFPMLPGLIRTLATPASIAFKANLMVFKPNLMVFAYFQKQLIKSLVKN